MQMKKNIAFLVYDISLIGGAEVITKQLAKELSNTHNVLIISLFEKSDVKVECYSYINICKEVKSITFNLHSLAKGVRRVLSEHKIDILFAVTAGVNSVAIKACKRMETKVVYVEHSNLANQSYGKKHFYRQRLGANKGDHVVTLTQRDKDNYLKTFHLNDGKVSVIPNWYEKASTPNKYDVKSKRIISVGRLVALKGYEDLLKVAKKVFKEYPEWRWDIYGDGCERAKFNGIINQLHLENNVFLKGNVSNIKELYQKYALFVMTSYYEGLPMAMLEALAAGLPVVSFDCMSGPREIILNQVNGDLIKERDLDAMAQKIAKLLSNDDLRIAYALHASDNLDKFSKEVVLAKWNALIALL